MQTEDHEFLYVTCIAGSAFFIGGLIYCFNKFIALLEKWLELKKKIKLIKQRHDVK